jgi:hypothetical protein
LSWATIIAQIVEAASHDRSRAAFLVSPSGSRLAS